MTKTKATRTTRASSRKSTLVADVHLQLGAPPSPGVLGAVERRVKRQRSSVPANADPVAELRRLVQDHKALTKKSVAMTSMVTDRKNRTTGEVIPCRVPDDRAAEMRAVAKALKDDADRLQALMLRELKGVPIYRHLLSRVFGLGPIVCAYLVAMVDIRKAVKPSNLRRFCGLAVINGRLERPTRGVKLGYCAELRTRLYQACAAMWKNSGKRSVCETHGTLGRVKMSAEERVGYKAALAACPDCAATEYANGSTSKYLDVWRGYKHRMQHSERFDAEKNRLLSGRALLSESECGRASDIAQVNAIGPDRHGHRTEANAISGERALEVEQMRRLESAHAPGAASWRPGARAIIHATGWHKSAEVLLEDIYIVWRTLEGLPVWPSYYAAKLGYAHGGRIEVNAPKFLTLEEALEMVGDVGSRPAVVAVDESEGVGDDGEEEA